MNSKQKFRARFILIILVLAALGLSASLYQTQIVQGKSYAIKADKQYDKPRVALFDRGTIFFEAKDGTRAAAATVESGYLIHMNPKLLTDPENTYEALSHYLTVDKAEFLRKANRKDDPYEEILHRVDEKTAESVRGLGITGITLSKETWRSYPAGEVAAHVLGLTGQNTESAIEGRYGLERIYENILDRTGPQGGANAFAELFSGIRESVFGDLAGQGSVVTTIEPTVQKYIEKTLTQTSYVWKPDEIGAIIIDPATGEIISMVSLPTYDPNDVSNIKDASIFSNPLVEHVYEMGSIIKPLTMAIGLDSKAITAASTYDDTGTMTLNTKKISNFDGKARGVINVSEILTQSLNVGAATVALKVGKSDFVKYIHALGFGEKTGIDQPSESGGLIRNLENGQDIEVATAAYGQGIALSPIAITRSLSVLANGGFMVSPHLVKEIDYNDGTNKKIEGEKKGPVLRKETTDEVTRMLVHVVDTALLKGEIKMEHYSVAAKTGTAQIPDPANKGYYSDRYLHSFFGYFPAYKPKFLVFMYQIHPKGAQYASETLTKPFSEISKFLIDYYSIPPDR